MTDPAGAELSPGLPVGPLSPAEQVTRLLIEQRQSWQRGDRTPVEVLLADHPTLQGDDEGILDLVYNEVVLRGERGEAPQVDEYVRRFPQYEAPLRRQFALHGALVAPTPEESFDAASGLEGGHRSAQRDEPRAAASDTAGLAARYRPLRFHARGGLGEVFVARDVDLHRDVALKRLQAAGADDPAHRRRFLLEAEITGRLEHPGVVPVYGLGHDARGRPCYVMRFIQGQTLLAALQQFHARDRPDRDPGEHRVALRHLLSRFLGVCNTIAYAHSRGILHRDLKPSNILLGKYGETLVVDWGLAKPFDCGAPLRRVGEDTLTPATVSSACGTQQGDVLGTPAYMSPEQAAGRGAETSPASDVYGLGATLYELLTGAAPVQGTSIGDVLARAQRGDFPSPRQRKRNVPPALAAICQKAMALRPEDRYATALGLAGDLEHWLADEPVTAYREPWTVKAWRWARRRRTLVSGASAAVLVTLLAGGGIWLWQIQVQAETAQQVEGAVSEAKALLEQDRSGPALAAARRAEGLLERQVGNRRLRQRVQSLLVDLQMVERLEEVRLRQTELKEARFDLARADPDYTAAFQEYGLDVDNLAPEEAADRIRAQTIKAKLVVALDDWASVRRRTGKGGVADWQRLMEIAQRADEDLWRNKFRDALERLDREALTALAAEEEVAALPAPTWILLGNALAAMGAVPEAVKALSRGRQQHPGDFWINYRLASYLSQLGPTRADEAIRFFTVAAALRSQSPSVHLSLGVVLAKKGDLDQAILAYRAALRLNNDYPDAHYNLANALNRKGQLDQAIEAYRDAIRLRNSHEANNNLGVALLSKGNVDEAIVAFQESIRLNKNFAQAHNNLGNALKKKEKLDEAIAAYREAIRLNETFAEAYCNLGLTLQQQRQFTEALDALKRGHELGSRRPGWAYPSEEWIRECERLLEQDKLGKTEKQAKPGPDRPQP